MKFGQAYFFAEARDLGNQILNMVSLHAAQTGGRYQLKDIRPCLEERRSLPGMFVSSIGYANSGDIFFLYVSDSG
jgi:hypothetical protein